MAKYFIKKLIFQEKVSKSFYSADNCSKCSKLFNDWCFNFEEEERSEAFNGFKSFQNLQKDLKLFIVFQLALMFKF